MPDVLRAFAEALHPGGMLLLGFFSGGELLPFAHRVVTAWAWPLAEVTRVVDDAGFAVVGRRELELPNGRITASLVARRTG